jgi:hypothetical protein
LQPRCIFSAKGFPKIPTTCEVLASATRGLKSRINVTLKRDVEGRNCWLVLPRAIRLPCTNNERNLSCHT